MSVFKLRPGVVLVEITDTYFLAADREARKQCPYISELNEEGAMIWKQIEKQKSLPDILAKLSLEYDIPENLDIEADVNSFLNELREQHYLIHEADEI